MRNQPSPSRIKRSAPALLLGACLTAVFAVATAAPAFAVAPETPRTEPTSAVTATNATFNGVLSPASPGEIGSTYDFLYKASATECKGGSATSPVVSIMGSEAEPVAEPVIGLASGTTYTVCLVVHNKAKTEEAVGSAVTFTTVPTPATEEVKAITTTFAQFHGHLTPLNPGTSTQYHFNYKLKSTECAGESSTRAKEAGKGPGTEVTAIEGVGTLEPNAEYTVCLVTSNAFGSEEGLAVHFKTLAAPPYVASETASGATSSGATLEAQINPNNQKTNYAFEYATNEALTGATVVPGATELEGYGAQTASVALTGLKTGETYYYRVIAENTSSKVESGVDHFTALGVPRIATEEAQDLTSSSAELAGIVNPAGLPTKYHFLFVPASAYNPGAEECAVVPVQLCAYGAGTSTPESSVAPNSTVTHPVFYSADGLQPGTTYDYALVATNEQGGPVVGVNQTFTTAAAPPAPLITNPSGTGEVTPPPAAALPSTLPPLGGRGLYLSIAQLDATEAKEGKATNPPSTTSLTNAQKLAKALKACRGKDHKKAKREQCEKAARKQYGPLKAKKGKRR